MKGINYLRPALGIAVLLVLIKVSINLIAEPWAGRKMEKAVNGRGGNFNVEIGAVHFRIFKSGIDLEKVTIHSNQEPITGRNFHGEIASVRFNAISLLRLIFKNDVNVGEVIISDVRLTGEIPPPRKSAPMLAPSPIKIGSIQFDKINLALIKADTKQSYTIDGGNFKVYNLKIAEKDSLTIGIVRQFDFGADALGSVSADSLYTYKASGVDFSTTSHTLKADSLLILPNYSDYGFTSRSAYQSDRIEAVFTGLLFHHLPVEDFLSSASLISTFIEIGKMDIRVFRDQRKEFRHVVKTTIQDLIYRYPGYIRVDSILVANGNVLYTAHALKANEPGHISFNDLHARLFKITNDTVYKTEKAFMELHADALLMGKGKLAVILKSKIYDHQNSFSLTGNLAEMAADKLNPILEKNAFIFVTSGTIDAMKFGFLANNEKATGNMILLYHGLDLALKNKRTEDTTGLVERIKSFFINRKLLDSNPLPGKGIRTGTIDYERDPEKFLFGYCFKSILSGMKSSLAKNSGEIRKSKPNG
ncbi:MAG: hypothetical protein WC699_05865 [Bacteroidales bacterium]|jgi:hypothetical protein